jgi:hypothetical protein
VAFVFPTWRTRCHADGMRADGFAAESLDPFALGGRDGLAVPIWESDIGCDLLSVVILRYSLVRFGLI